MSTRLARPSSVDDDRDQLRDQRVAYQAAREALWRALPFTYAGVGGVYAFLSVCAHFEFGIPSQAGFGLACALVSVSTFALAFSLHRRPPPVETTRRWMLLVGSIVNTMSGWAMWLTGDPAMTPYLFIMAIAAGYFFLEPLDFAWTASGAVAGFVAGWFSPVVLEGWAVAGAQMSAMLVFGAILNSARRRQVTAFARLQRENAERDQALRVSEQRWRGFADTARDIIAVVDRDEGVLYVNDRFHERHGFAAGHVLGRDPVALVRPSEQAAARRAMERWWAGSEEVATVPSLTESEDVVWLEVSATAVPVQGEQGGLILVARDVTERRALDERLRTTQKEEGLSLMAAGVAHDFNNLLAVILGEAELAGQDAVTASVRDGLGRIESATERARELTHQLLAYSGHAVPQRRSLDLSDQAREMRNLVRSTLASSVDVLLDLASPLPAVKADPSQIQQVLMNLLWNAAEASDDGATSGRVRIRTGVRALTSTALDRLVPNEERPAGRYVFVEVTDDGRGMDGATLDRIFDPFFSTKSEGRGLGLAASVGIVRAHGGGIAVASRPGRGSRFTVYLPAVDAPVDDRPVVAPARSAGRGRVLVVDDEEVVRMVTARQLTSLGYTVDQAKSGREAIDRLRSAPGDHRLVVLDMTMPGLDGAATLEAIRDGAPELPVLLSSGYGEKQALLRIARRRHVAFLQKPFKRDALARAIESLVRPASEAPRQAEER